MIVKSNGIIINTIKYSESSIICKVFTEEHGILSFIIRGVRSSNKKEKAGLFQPLNIIEIVFLLQENKNLLYLKEYRAAYNYQYMPYQFGRSSYGLFLLEILNKTMLIEREPNTEKFKFLFNALMYLDNTEKVSANFHLSFMIKYITHIGFEMEIDEKVQYFDLQSGHATDLTPNHPYFIQGQEKNICYQLKQFQFEELHAISLNKDLRSILLKHLEYFYKFHVENFSAMKSPEIIAELYA